MKHLYSYQISSGSFFTDDEFGEAIQIGNLIIKTTKKGKDYGFVKWFNDIETEFNEQKNK